MKVKMILPALTEAQSPFFRHIKYSLFPPLGLATLAGYLRANDDVRYRTNMSNDSHSMTLLILLSSKRTSPMPIAHTTSQITTGLSVLMSVGRSAHDVAAG